MKAREPIDQFMYDLFMVLETTQAARLTLEQDESMPATAARGALRLACEKLRTVVDDLDKYGIELSKPATA